MTRFLFVAILVLSTVPAYAMPQFLELYRMDPFRNPNVDGCITCHMSPQGGDARNPFGQAFESANYQITPMLRAQFPDRFVYPTSRVSGALTVHFSDPNKKQVVIETVGMKNLVDVDAVTVNGVPATAPGVPTTEVSPVSLVAQSEVPVDQYAREGAFFGPSIVNLPNGKPLKRGEVDFFIGHRFSENIKAAGLGGLFGFDSAATIAFGVSTGITDRLSISLLRSKQRRTILLESAFQVMRQSRSMPFTLQFRAGVEGINNGGIFHKDPEEENVGVNQLEIRHYSPSIQVPITRTFQDRLSVSLVPIFAFNTREERRVTELSKGAEHNNTISAGVGLGFRFLPTASIVGEYIPRVWGFKAEVRNTPGISKDQGRLSVGLQKSTFRHTFELVVTRQMAMTPATYAFQGVDTFRIGFNVYRRIR